MVFRRVVELARLCVGLTLSISGAVRFCAAFVRALDTACASSKSYGSEVCMWVPHEYHQRATYARRSVSAGSPIAISVKFLAFISPASKACAICAVSCLDLQYRHAFCKFNGLLRIDVPYHAGATAGDGWADSRESGQRLECHFPGLLESRLAGFSTWRC